MNNGATVSWVVIAICALRLREVHELLGYGELGYVVMTCPMTTGPSSATGLRVAGHCTLH